jgi:type IV pilus assembly protein PilC
LEVLERQEKNLAFKYTIGSLADNIRSGNTLSDGLQQHPKIFDRLFVNMVKAGEAGGVLDTVLGRLAKFMEKSEKIKSRVKSAMVYPVVVMVVAVLIVGALMAFVVPKFQQIFEELLKGEPLPAPTQLLLSISDAITQHYLVSIGVIVAMIISFVLFKKSAFGQRILDRVYLVVPIFGELVRMNAIARFSRTLGTLLQSGVPILDALRITRDTISNSVVMNAIDMVHDRVKEGEGVSAPLERTKVFPSMVTSMIDVGEETGELPEMLNRVADTYEEEVDNTVGAITSIIEPIMIVGLALVVGFIVIALFLPMVTIIQKMTSG